MQDTVSMPEALIPIYSNMMQRSNHQVIFVFAVLHSGLQHIHLLLTPPTMLAWGALDDSPHCFTGGHCYTLGSSIQLLLQCSLQLEGWSSTVN